MNEPKIITDEVLRSLLDEIATALVLADDADKDSLLSVEELLADLRSLAEKVNSSLWLGRAKEWSARLKAAQSCEGKPALRALDALTARVADIKSRPVMLLQPEPETPALSAKSADDTGGFERPLWVEQEVLSEFLSEQGELADELEAEILALESENPDLAALRRRIHTVKGEAGVLGMDDLAQVCHSLEDFLDSSQQLEGRVDLLLVVKDWIADALDAYTKGRLPKSSAAEVVKRLGIPLADTSSSEPSESKPAAKSETTNIAGKQHPSEGDAIDSRALQLRQTLKVDLERVDHLVELIGELVIAESMVAHAPEISAVESPRVHSNLSQLNRITRELQDAGMRMRMVPLRSLFQKMTRMARDAAHRSGKDVRLIAVGQGTEIDRSMVERIADPIMHLIRNAVSHGIETREKRLAAGKPTEGTILLSAQTEGGSIIIEVADDGCGLDHQKILARARHLGLVDPTEDASRLSEQEVLNLVFHPGLSTADRITEVSGRGVGLDVVKKNISSIRGRATVTSDPGEGTTFSIILPLTLAIIDGMLVACGSERYVIPTLSVVESIQVKPGMLSNCAGQLELVNVRGKTLPLIRLADLLEIKGAITDPCQGLVVIVEGVGQRLALLVDEVINQQQVVIKSLGDGIEQTQLISGGAIMSDGRVGLILNVEDLATVIAEPAHLSNKLGAKQQSNSRQHSPGAVVTTAGDEMNQQKEEGA
jgi:two-component system chemotaxis sensor kinase CheA